MPAARPEPYFEFLAEREELLRHKWLLSEQSGRDVGFERALLDWATRHRPEWRQKRNKLLGIDSAGLEKSSGK